METLEIMKELRRIRRTCDRVEAWCVENSSVAARDGSLGSILAAASAVTKFSEIELLGRSKWTQLNLARTAMVFVMVTEANIGTDRIGVFMRRDGSAIRHAQQKAAGWYSVDAEFRRIVTQIREAAVKAFSKT